MELKKDNITEETLEADLHLRHGDRAPLPPSSMVWGREKLLDFCINLSKSKCSGLYKIMCLPYRETKYTSMGPGTQ